MIFRRVVGNSMRPTLFEGDIVVARKRKTVDVDDIVVARHKGIEIIKRVKKVTKKQYFLEGDNKSESTDSRQFGSVPKNDVKAVAVFVVGTSRFLSKKKQHKRTGIRFALASLLVFSGVGFLLYGNFAKSEQDEKVANQARQMSQNTIIPGYKLNEIKKDVPYCNGLALDLYYPRKAMSKTAPVIVYIHGGAWEMNNKSSEMNQIALIDGLRDEGYAIASIDYRKLPEFSFPSPVTDALCSVRFLRAEQANLGIDGSKIGMFGFSAGGHLAAMVATLDSKNQFSEDQPYPDQSSRISVVVTLAGLFDFENGLRENNMYRLRYFLKTADWRTAAPANYVTSDDPPVLMVHGLQDQFVSPEQDAFFAEKLKNANVKYEILDINNADHGLGEVGGSRSESIEDVSITIRDFIKQNINGKTN